MKADWKTGRSCPSLEVPSNPCNSVISALKLDRKNTIHLSFSLDSFVFFLLKSLKQQRSYLLRIWEASAVSIRWCSPCTLNAGLVFPHRGHAPDFSTARVQMTLNTAEASSTAPRLFCLLSLLQMLSEFSREILIHINVVHEHDSLPSFNSLFFSGKGENTYGSFSSFFWMLYLFIFKWEGTAVTGEQNKQKIHPRPVKRIAMANFGSLFRSVT